MFMTFWWTFTVKAKGRIRIRFINSDPDFLQLPYYNWPMECFRYLYKWIIDSNWVVDNDKPTVDEVRTNCDCQVSSSGSR